MAKPTVFCLCALQNAVGPVHRSQRLFSELLAGKEREDRRRHLEWLKTAIEYKAQWELELERRAGKDALYGGTEADTFVFLAGSGFDVTGDFKASEGGTIDLHVHSNGVTNGGGIVITASGGSVYVNIGSGNVIFVANAFVSDVSSHIVW